MAEAAAPMLEVRDLEVHFPLRGSFAGRLVGRSGGVVKAVDGVSFELQQGEVLGWSGSRAAARRPSGGRSCGWSTPTGGSIILEGRDVTGLGDRRCGCSAGEMQMVFQDPHASLNPAMDDRDGGRPSAA